MIPITIISSTRVKPEREAAEGIPAIAVGRFVAAEAIPALVLRVFMGAGEIPALALRAFICMACICGLTKDLG
jgi:hypothetical protein